MEQPPKLPAVIRYPIAFGLAYFAASRMLDLAEHVEFLKSTVGTPLHAIAQNSVEQILFTIVLVFPALYIVDWLLKSRAQAILISLAAVIAALWFAAPDW